MAERPLIYFIRHGLTDWNITRRIQGQAERDITEVGRMQATRNGEKLLTLIGAGTDYDFVASPMRRTRETMERVRHAMRLDPTSYRTDDRLMELNFGDWQGLTEEEINSNRPEDIIARSRDKWRFIPPGQHAESYEMLSIRFENWLQSVNQKTVCVTHGGCIRTLFYLYGGLPKEKAANISIPQDKVLRYSPDGLEWL